MSDAIYLSVVIIAGIQAVRGLEELRVHLLPTLVMSGYGLIYGLVPLIANSPASESIGAALASLVGVLGLSAGLVVGQRLIPALPISIQVANHSRRVRFAWVTLGLFAVGKVVGSLNSPAGLAGLFSSGRRFEFRGLGNPLLSVLTEGGNRLILVALFLFLLSDRRITRIAISLLAIGAALLLFILSAGSRALPLATASLPIIAAIVRRPRVGHLWQPIRLLALGVTMIIMLTGLYEARKDLSNETSLTAISQAFTEYDAAAVYDREPLNYSLFLAHATDEFTQERGVLWAYPFRRLVFFPFPSGNLKPPDPNREFAKSLRGDLSTATIPPSLPGEGFITLGGQPGVFLMLLVYGVLLAVVMNLQSTRLGGVIVSALAVEEGLLMLRGQFYDLTVRVALVILLSSACWFVARLALRRGAGHGALESSPRQ